MLTQLLAKQTHWTKHQKKAIVNLVSSKTKVDNCYSGHILNILFRKWFPLFKMPSLRTITLEEPISPNSHDH